MVSSGMFLDSNLMGDFRSAGVVGMFVFLSVLMVSVFSFVSIAVWSEARRKEREAYYKAESLRRLADIPGDGGKYVIEMMREEERIRRDTLRDQEIKQRQGMKVGGLVTIAVGLALMIFLRSVGGGNSAYLVGLVPGLIGVALLISGIFVLPRSPIE